MSLDKIANAVRLLGSGPRSGLAELVVLADGLSSSIMPGKTNPIRSEALTLLCAQVMDPARSLVLVTALNPRIGYDAAVRIGKTALAENLTLKDAAAKLGLVSPENFERWLRPEEMVEPGATLAGG